MIIKTNKEISKLAKLGERVKSFERELIIETLKQTDGSVLAAAHALEIPTSSLYRKIQQHEIMIIQNTKVTIK